MVLHLRIIGILLMILALIHIVFPKYFSWKEDLKSLSLVNRQMMKIHTFFIALTVFMMGLLCYASPNEIIETKLGKTISLGFGIFWCIRLIVQFFGYSQELWRGKRLETMIHVFFSFFWAYLTSIFLFNYLKG